MGWKKKQTNNPPTVNYRPWSVSWVTLRAGVSGRCLAKRPASSTFLTSARS